MPHYLIKHTLFYFILFYVIFLLIKKIFLFVASQCFVFISLIYNSPLPSFPRIVLSRGRWQQVWHPACSDLKTPVKFITSPCWIQKEKQEEKNSTLKTSYPACSGLVFDRKIIDRHAASFVILKFLCVGNTFRKKKSNHIYASLMHQ